jgi:ubiquinol-cytochrome c reductase iron-sulfur subunit
MRAPQHSSHLQLAALVHLAVQSMICPEFLIKGAQHMAEADNGHQAGRRDFIGYAARAFVGVGGACALWPFIDQMNPNAGTPQPETSDIDLRRIPPGESLSVPWKGKPVFVRNRTRDEVQLARSTPLKDLPDPFARNDALPASTPATDENRTKDGHHNWLVVVGLCTHLGCILAPRGATDTAVTREGWFCPCHAARFDLSGRVRSGPARMNLPVPPYQFTSATDIRIG